MGYSQIDYEVSEQIATITTGTPSGVALARPEPERFYLKPGDVAEATIERIGTLRNPVAGA